MIQRIQTLYLLAAAVATAVTIWLPLATTDEPMSSSALFADSQFTATDHPALVGLLGLASLASLITIFLYRNRPLQLRLSVVSMLATILALIIAMALYLNEARSLTDLNTKEGWGIALPVLAIVLWAMAQRRIRKDEALVRAMDRLR